MHIIKNARLCTAQQHQRLKVAVGTGLRVQEITAITSLGSRVFVPPFVKPAIPSHHLKCLHLSHLPSISNRRSRAHPHLYQVAHSRKLLIMGTYGGVAAEIH
jgi:hypothetical protein